MKNDALTELYEIVANSFREQGVKAEIEAYTVQTLGGHLAVIYELTLPDDSTLQQNQTAQDIVNKEAQKLLLQRRKKGSHRHDP
jgi:hypothetical protein